MTSGAYNKQETQSGGEQNGPAISVLIANYNNARFIEEAVQSVINQTFKDWELICVDDASTDNSITEIERLAQLDDRISFYSNAQNGGCGYTKNHCAELARGESFLFLDPDDMLHPRVLEVLYGHFSVNKDVSLVYAQHYLCNENLEITSVSAITGPVPEDKTILTYRKHWPGQPALVNTRLYRNSPGINASLKRAVDRDLYVKLEEQAAMYFIEKPLYYYRRHEKGIATGEVNELKARYWALLVDEEAVKRRYQNTGRRDVSRAEMNLRWERYYLNRARIAHKQRKWEPMYFFIFQSFFKRPFSSHFLLKIKYLFSPLKPGRQ